MKKEIRDILRENEKRRKLMWPDFDPVTGKGSPGLRQKIVVRDFYTPEMWLPVEMMEEPLVKNLIKAKSIGKLVEEAMRKIDEGGAGNALERAGEETDGKASGTVVGPSGEAEGTVVEPSGEAEGTVAGPSGTVEDVERDDMWGAVAEGFIRVRVKYDFPFWAYTFVRIKPKKGGKDIPFRLNRAQRRLVEKLESLRKRRKPIRLVMLKARQWGGSTCIQMYMAWMQLVHHEGWNSTIASHANSVSATVRGMFSKMLTHYPAEMLHPYGSVVDGKEKKMTSFEGQQSIQFIPSRNCKIRIATAVKPDNLRSEDSSMVHCTEVSLWPNTKEAKTSDFVNAVLDSVGDFEDTMIVFESTAKGRTGKGKYFFDAYQDAEKHISNYDAFFVSWTEVEHDQMEFDSEEEKEEFARQLWENRENTTPKDRRHDSGAYNWWLWKQGATLEGLYWYTFRRASKTDGDGMKEEAPTTAEEAFTSTTNDIFNMERVDEMRRTCKEPMKIGEVQGVGNSGAKALDGVHFVEDGNGQLWIWSEPETFDGERVLDRYLAVVDIGGTWAGADYSVITVFDRYEMMEGGKPVVVAQWYGHIDHDLLAWKAAQISRYYDDALLVVEVNTLNQEKDMDADQSYFILNRLRKAGVNLYARRQVDERMYDKSETSTNYGFHTNRKTKPIVIDMLIEAVRDDLYVERDVRALEEMCTYEKVGTVYQAQEGYHDDILITRAIGLHICFNEMDAPQWVFVDRDGNVVDEKIDDEREYASEMEYEEKLRDEYGLI